MAVWNADEGSDPDHRDSSPPSIPPHRMSLNISGHVVIWPLQAKHRASGRVCGSAGQELVGRRMRGFVQGSCASLAAWQLL